MTDKVTLPPATVSGMRPVVLSASSVNTYLDCHLQWWFEYVATMTGLESEERQTGIAIHEYAEARLKAPDEKIVPADPTLAGLAEVWETDIFPTFRQPLHIEALFEINVNGVGFSGVLDAIDGQDVPWGIEYILRDLKSTKSRPSKGRYRFNMIGYWLGAREDLGVECAALQLDYIVRTKTPYYWPEVQPLPDRDEVEAWAGVLERVANGIARSDYRPSGLGTRACASCPHTISCGPYQRYQEVNQR